CRVVRAVLCGICVLTAPPTPSTYTRSLHDALPIFTVRRGRRGADLVAAVGDEVVGRDPCRGLLRRREGLRILGLRRRGVRGLTVIRFSARRARCGGTGLRILIGLEGLTAAVEEDAGIGGDPRMISLGDGDVLQRGVVDADADALPGVEFDRITGFD